jgi:hypothetical protein
MNKKLERYYDYIVNELLENTTIDMDNRFYKFPFMYSSVRWNMDVMDLTISIYSSPTNSNLFGHFYNYVNDMYGIKREEVMTLWKRYIDKLPQ